MCHIAVDHVPDQGLHELNARIEEISEFYRSQATVRTQPVREHVAGGIVRSEVRPTFTIEED